MPPLDDTRRPETNRRLCHLGVSSRSSRLVYRVVRNKIGDTVTEKRERSTVEKLLGNTLVIRLYFHIFLSDSPD